MTPDSYHIFHYYTTQLHNRKINRYKLEGYLSAQGIVTAIYYPVCLHLQEIYKPLGYKPSDFPEGEEAQKEVLSLPIYPELENEQIGETVKFIEQFLP